MKAFAIGHYLSLKVTFSRLFTFSLRKVEVALLTQKLRHHNKVQVAFSKSNIDILINGIYLMTNQRICQLG